MEQQGGAGEAGDERAQETRPVMQPAVVSVSAASTWFGCPTPTCPFRCSCHVGNKAFLFSGCLLPSGVYAQSFTRYAAGDGAGDR